MQNIIDKSYFWGSLLITGLNQDDSEIEMYIAKLQKIYLTKMFGEDIANDLPDELKAMLFDSTLKTSPIANYVYYYWQKANVNTPTNAGMKALDIPNTTDQSPVSYMVDAWNEMVEFNIKLHNKLYDQQIIEIAAAGSVEAYTIIFDTDIKPNVDYYSGIFKKQNLIGI